MQNMQKGMVMLEREIEQYLVQRVEALDGWALKYTSSTENGLPDRLCMIPGGHLGWVELKRPRIKPRPLQIEQMKRLKKLGQHVVVIDSKRKVDAFINYYRRRK